jgi:hypothetical protein
VFEKKRSGEQPQIAHAQRDNFYDPSRRHKLAANGMPRVRRGGKVSTGRLAAPLLQKTWLTDGCTCRKTHSHNHGVRLNEIKISPKSRQSSSFFRLIRTAI